MSQLPQCNAQVRLSKEYLSTSLLDYLSLACRSLDGTHQIFHGTQAAGFHQIHRTLVCTLPCRLAQLPGPHRISMEMCTLHQAPEQNGKEF